MKGYYRRNIGKVLGAKKISLSSNKTNYVYKAKLNK